MIVQGRLQRVISVHFDVSGFPILGTDDRATTAISKVCLQFDRYR